jgi:hypothetical protein
VYDLKQNGKIVLQAQMHQDSCASVSFHPSAPILASASGQRHGSVHCFVLSRIFSLLGPVGDDSESEDIVVIQNSIKFWEFPFAQTWPSNLATNSNAAVEQPLPHWLQLKTGMLDFKCFLTS